MKMPNLPPPPPSPLPPPPPPTPTPTPPPPPASQPSSQGPTPSKKQPTPISPIQVAKSRRGISPLTRKQDRFDLGTEKLRSGLILQQTRPRRTNLLVWCSAILCLLFSLILIFLGIATLIIFVAIKPRYPLFDISAANLNSIYFDSPDYFNGDLILLVNFSNPNKKLDVRFEYLDVGLYFSDRFIATQALQPFTLRKGEKRLESIHMISSLVYMPPNLGVQLQNQLQSNKVSYYVRGTFKVRATLGLVHFSYWLHGRCQLEMTSPPTGVLLGRICKAKR
ncbi:uncharacterized protein LOC115754138 [Rhodamnia argentea]|uniref:Uncharacterized protein LOC115754138 n=1 Tax=Rhodamnia argentea TaxID=178133 RepID=A0A8B8QP49_9MYRT|nr:uncharacterized protein LOC115754138 [Rhodamnia argentea]